MSVANLQNVPRTPEQFAIFSFANQTSHLLITRAIFNKLGIVVPLPALDPIPQFALLTWGEQHAALHSLQRTGDVSSASHLGMVRMATFSRGGIGDGPPAAYHNAALPPVVSVGTVGTSLYPAMRV